ncbi:MAG: hypothetical protein ACK4SY_02235 [Pyrobaculum sp.]
MIVCLFTVRQWLLHRWVFSYAASLVLILLFIFYTAYFGLAWIQPEFYGRVAVAVVNAALFLVSLSALLIPLFVYQDDRETGLYEWFISRPVRRFHLCRWLGVAASLSAATIASFLVAMSLNYLMFRLFVSQMLIIAAVFMALIFSLSAVSYLISMALPDKASALGAGFFLWLYLNIIHTIVAMVFALGSPPDVAFVIYVLSPVESARFLSFYVVDPTLSFLNPVTAIDLTLSLQGLLFYLPVAVLATPIVIALAVFRTLP